jgi:hypothetical protein
MRSRGENGCGVVPYLAAGKAVRAGALRDARSAAAAGCGGRVSGRCAGTGCAERAKTPNGRLPHVAAPSRGAFLFSTGKQPAPRRSSGTSVAVRAARGAVAFAAKAFSPESSARCALWCSSSLHDSVQGHAQSKRVSDALAAQACVAQNETANRPVSRTPQIQRLALSAMAADWTRRIGRVRSTARPAAWMRPSNAPALGGDGARGPRRPERGAA